MSALDTDTGWTVESSPGTPTQAEQPAPIPEQATAPPVEETAPPTEATPAEAEQRARDDKGRFATAEEAAAEEAATEPVEADKPPGKRTAAGRKMTLQQEIDLLTRQKNDEAREIERLRAERQKLQPVAPAQPEAPADKFPSYEVWAADKPDAAYEDYIDARADWRSEQKFRALQQETQAQADARQVQERQRALRDKGLLVYSDWDDVFNRVDLTVPMPVMNAILTDPDGHRLAYELATHPDQVRAWNAMDPLQIGVALGTLKARLAGASAAPPAQSVTTPAPPPIKPLGSSPTQPIVNPDDVPFEKWTPEMVRKMNERDRKAGRL